MDPMREDINKLASQMHVETTQVVKEDPDPAPVEKEEEPEEEEGEKLSDLSGEELLSKWQDEHKIHHFEGESGFKNLEKVMTAIGYRDDGLYGGVMSAFFSDNPGAMGAVVEWIGQNLDSISDWKDAILSDISGGEEEESKVVKEDEGKPECVTCGEWIEGSPKHKHVDGGPMCDACAKEHPDEVAEGKKVVKEDKGDPGPAIRDYDKKFEVWCEKAMKRIGFKGSVMDFIHKYKSLDPHGSFDSGKSPERFLGSESKIVKEDETAPQAEKPEETPSGPKYPHIKVKLVGEDGNAFFILGRVAEAMRRGKVSREEIKAFQDEATSGDYDHLLQTVMKWVDADGGEDDEDEEEDECQEK